VASPAEGSAALGYRTVLGGALAPPDWTEDDRPEEIGSRIVPLARNGDLITLHFHSGAGYEALPAVIDGLRARRFEIGGLESLPANR
jgi:hypothetical protein